MRILLIKAVFYHYTDVGLLSLGQLLAFVSLLLSSSCITPRKSMANGSAQEFLEDFPCREDFLEKVSPPLLIVVK